MNFPHQKIRYFSIFSRLAILGIQIISNWLIPDHDADAFKSPRNPNLSYGWADSIIEFCFGGLVRWDAQYYIHIAQYGYTHESTLAFFPFFPLIIRYVGLLIYIPLQLVANYYSCIVLGSVLLNLVIFVKCSLVFYDLSCLVLKKQDLAFKSALLFCINPASIFFSAPYSETVYSYLVFSGLLALEKRNQALSWAAFSVASFARSNALVNLGFLIYRKLQETAFYFSKIRNAKTETGYLPTSIVLILSLNYAVIPVFFFFILVLLPFALFQYWCYSVYCSEDESPPRPEAHIEVFLRSNFLHSPDLGPAEWCYEAMPLAYPHIQNKYWEVGAFRYYSFRQLPNFLLALPVVLIVICHSALYFVDNVKVCLRLGIPPSHLREVGSSESCPWRRIGVDSYQVFVYTCHALVLSLFCVICIHVQVSTRLLCSSSPVIYWFVANQIGSLQVNEGSTGTCDSKAALKSPQGGRKSRVVGRGGIFNTLFASFRSSSFSGKILLTYFISYSILGTVLFSNFLPWT